MENDRKSRAELIEILLNAIGRPATARELINIISPNNKNQSNIDSELRYMVQQGKIVRSGVGKSDDPFYYDLANRKSINYYFVFQNKTYNSEIPGGYLWAPHGNKSHWKSMDTVKVGDVILSCYDQNIVAVGITKSVCYDAPKPSEFGTSGDDWKDAGRKIDVDYYLFQNTMRPIDYMDNILACFPVFKNKNLPFTSEGRSNTGYLFNFNKAAAEVVISAISNSGKPSTIAGKVKGNDEVVKKPVVNKTLQMKIADFDKTVHDGESALIAKIKQFVSEYTVMKLFNLPKEDYVYGSGRKDTFCYRVTHELYWWGSIRNGTPNKYGFYYDPHENKYQTVAKFGLTDTAASTEAAYNSVKDAIYQLIVDGGNEDYAAIESNPLSKIFKGKLLCIYYPEKYMNVYSESHMKYYMDELGIIFRDTDGYMTWLKQIIDWKNDNPITKSWTNHEFSKFLYHGIGYPPDSEKQKKEVKKYEKKIDDELLESIDEVPAEELPNDNAYTPEPEDRKDPVVTGESYSYPRDKNTALKALKRANYECEIDKDHPSFTRKTNGTNYTEPHHLIPMAEQDNYEHCLDVQANIVSLCSNCHNQLHYGQDPIPLLTKLYEARENELKAARIEITLDELIRLYK